MINALCNHNPIVRLDPNTVYQFKYWPQSDVVKESKVTQKGAGDRPLQAVRYSLVAKFFVNRSENGLRSDFFGDCEGALTRWLKAWLRDCLRKAEQLKPLVEKDKLSPTELDKIQVIVTIFSLFNF